MRRMAELHEGEPRRAQPPACLDEQMKKKKKGSWAPSHRTQKQDMVPTKQSETFVESGDLPSKHAFFPQENVVEAKARDLRSLG